MKKNGAGALIYHCAFILFIMAPLLIIIAVAFTDKGYISLPTDGLSLRWFKALKDTPQMQAAFFLSLKLAATSSTVAVALAVPAAVAIARHRFFGRDVISAFLMSPMMIPNVVLGIAFLRFFDLIGLTGSFPLLCCAHIIFIMPYAMRLILAATIGMDRDAESAARSLGASRLTTFRRVFIPLILSGLAGGWILSFIQSFDELTMTIFVATPGTSTLPVVMYNHIAQTIDPLVTSVSAVLIAMTLGFMVLLDRIIGLDTVLIGKN